MKTKEAQSIGNSISVLDSSLKFSGLINIKANDHGYITQLNHQTGDYVQDGEQLAAISRKAAKEALRASGDDVPVALVMLQANVSRAQATRALKSTKGNVRQAIAAARSL